jgi:hypothetical protein
MRVRTKRGEGRSTMRARILRLLAVACLAPAALVAVPQVAGAAAGADVHQGVDVVRASGAFAAALDLASLRLQPLGNRCVLTVNGTLTFSGTLQGTATGTTTAFEEAPCEQVAANPPGTFADVFRSTGTFSGVVDGQPVSADIVYAGRTAAGGAIHAIMRFTGDVTGVVQVVATVGVGGTYRGVLVLH